MQRLVETRDLPDDWQVVISIPQFMNEFVNPNVGHNPGTKGRVVCGRVYTAAPSAKVH
jgi:hypothetical protein